MKLLSLIKTKIFSEEDSSKNKKSVNIAAALLILGIVLIAFSSFFPQGGKSENSEKTAYEITDLRDSEEKRLEKILCKIEGVNSVRVLISFSDSGRLEALTEEKTVLKNSKSMSDTASTETQTERKPVYDGDKNVIPKTQYMPEIKGVCVFYSGKNDSITQDKLYRAVKGSLGVGIHKAEVIHISE